MVVKDGKVNLELLARRVIMVLLVQLELQGLWVQGVFQVKEGEQVLKVLQVLVVLLVRLV